MKKNIIVGAVGIVVVVALLFGFKALINRSEDRESVENKKNETTSVLDLEKVYPKNPDEVVEKFAQINKYVYSNDLSEEEMEEVFGKEITKLVQGVTKLSKINFSTEISTPNSSLTSRLRATSWLSSFSILPPGNSHIPSNSPYPRCVAKYAPSRCSIAATTSMTFIIFLFCLHDVPRWLSLLLVQGYS